MVKSANRCNLLECESCRRGLALQPAWHHGVCCHAPKWYLSERCLACDPHAVLVGGSIQRATLSWILSGWCGQFSTKPDAFLIFVAFSTNPHDSFLKGAGTIFWTRPFSFGPGYDAQNHKGNPRFDEFMKQVPPQSRRTRGWGEFCRL